MARPKTSKKSAKASPKAASKASDPKPASKASCDFPEVRSLIDLLKENDLAVLEVEKDGLRVTLKTPVGASSGSIIHASPVATAPAISNPSDNFPSAEAPKGNYKEITSPMVGTFYASPSPEAPAFAEVGKTVTPETVVCIIEAMKVMNEIKAEVTGKVVEVVAENGKPVQFGQVLFRVS